MKIGYVRVSTREQNTARQDEIMKGLGVDKVFTDKLSGKNTDRPQFMEMMAFVREGDTVIVESISRMGRNTKQLLDTIDQLTAKGVQFISQKEQLDTNTAMGRFVLTIFSAIAEMEREYINQRQREGIDIAMAEGRFNGRPKKSLDQFEEVYNAWRSKKITASKASRQLEVARSTFYRRAKEYEGEEDIDF
jgi:DNA invertase Pin-like site-specific DNA recombinase